MTCAVRRNVVSNRVQVVAQTSFESCVQSAKLHAFKIYLFLREDLQITKALGMNRIVSSFQKEAKWIAGRTLNALKAEPSPFCKHRVFGLRHFFQPTDHRNVEARER